jgi:T1SS-143 domain-containing protein
MNGPFQVAQANIAGQTPGKPPARIVKIAKPFSDQSVVVALSYDGSVRADLSAIAGEKITLVHIGEKLIILFDNKSTVTLEPFFDSTGKPIDSLTVEVSPGRNLTGAEFAALFPVTEDQSVLPAAGDGNGNAQASGANFSSVGVDPLALPGPLDLLGQEELPNFVITNLLTPALEADLIPSQIAGARVGGVTEEEQLGGIISEGGPSARAEISELAQLYAIGSGGKEDPNDVTLPNSNGTASDGLDQDTPEDSFVTTQFFHGAGANALTNLVASGSPPLTFTIDAATPNSAVVDTTGAVVKSAGHELHYSAIDTSVAGDNTVVGGYSGEGGFHEVFRLTIHSDGTYDFELLDKIDHPVHTTDTGSTSNGHLEETLFFDFTTLVHVADVDNDNFTLTGTGAFTIGVIDDTPEVSVTAAGEQSLSLVSLDESIGNGLGDGNAATDDVINHTAPDPTGVNAIGEVKSVDFALANLFSVNGTTGEDGLGAVDFAFTLTLGGAAQNGGVATSLSVTDPNHVYGNDSTIYLFSEGGQIVGRVGAADGAIALRISIENPGDPNTAHFVVDQYLPVNHGADGNNFDSSLPLTLVGDGTLGVTLTTTVTDGDGDVATSAATVTIVDNETSPISIEDDGPTITAGEGGETTPLAVLNLDETTGADRYNAGETESSGGASNGADDKAATVTVSVAPFAAQAIGELSTGTGALAGLFTAAGIDFGTDGPAAGGGITNELSLVLSSETVGTNLTATALAGTALQGMTSGQRAIELVQVNATTIEGRLVGDGIASNGDEYVAFRITLENPNDPATAKITVDQFLAIDHGGSENPSVFDEQTLLTLIGNGALDLKLVTTVTDGDGDHASLPVQVNLIGNENSFIAFDDDGPKPLSISATNGAANGLFFEGFVPNNDAWGAGSGINNSGTAGAWHISASGVEGASTIQLERVGDNYRGSDSPTNSVMVDLEATPGNIKVSQDLTLTPGAVYHLTFEIGAANDPGVANSAKLEVFWNGVSVGTYTPTSGVMQTISIDVTAADANNQLTFQEIGKAGDNTGTFLANVKLSDVIIIDETKGVDADSDDTAANLSALFSTVTNGGPVGVDPDMDQPQYAQGLHSVVVLGTPDFGKDGPAATNPIQIGLSVSSAGVDSGLTTTEGKAIHLYVEGALVVGRFDSDNNGSYDTAAFALSIDPNGGILSIAQYVSLHHPDTHSNDEGVYLKPGTVLATVTLTDGDGDHTTTSADISSAVRFEDDGPSIDPAQDSSLRDWTIDEDVLPTAGHSTPHGNDALDNPADTNDYTQINDKPLGVTWGADGPKALTFAATDLQHPTITVTDQNGNSQPPLTSGGVALVYSITTNTDGGQTLVAYKGSVSPANEVFKLTLDPDAGTSGTFSFELTGALDHPVSDGQNTLNLRFGFTATDGDGDTATSFLTMRITDDVPYASGAVISRTVDEDDIDTPWSHGTSPDDGSADGSTTENSTGAAFISGTLAGLVAPGADLPGKFAFTSNAVVQLTALGLFSKESALGNGENGKPLGYTISNGPPGSNEIVITGNEPNPQGNPVFSLTLNTVTGAYEFRLFDELIHMPGDGQNDDLRSGQPSGSPLVQHSIPYLDLGSIITYTDKDGDTVNLGGKFTVTITDDVPHADIDINRNASITIDESGGNEADNTTSSSVRNLFKNLENSGVVGDDPDVSGDSNGGSVAGNGAIAYAHSNFAIVSDNSTIGSDSPPYPHQYALSIVGGAASGLFVTDGSPINLSVNADGLVIGTVVGGAFNGKVAFAIAIESDGEVSVAQYLSLKHDDRGDSNETNDNGTGGNDASPDDTPNPIQQTLDGKILVTLTVTDSDGDKSTDTANIGKLITFLDDGPSLRSNATVALEDDDLAGGNEGGPGDDNAPLNASGTLSHDYGADGPGSTLLTGVNLPSGLGFTSSVSSDGLTLIIKQNGVDVLKIELTDSTDGGYTVTQLHAIDHPTLNGQNGDDTENNVEFTVSYRVTDGDGDFADGSLKINVDDDTPEPNFVLQSGKLVVIDETAGLQNATATPGVPDDANDNDTSNPFPVAVTNPGVPAADSTLFGAPQVAQSNGAVVAVTPHYGADGPGSTVFTIDVPGSSTSSGLTTVSGQPITLFEVNANLIVGRYDGPDAGSSVGTNDPAAFAIYINPTTGVISVVQYVAIKHDDRGDFDENNDDGSNGNDASPNDTPNPVQQSIIDSAIRVTVTVTDHDGDSVDATYNIGSKIVFEDDGPAISITATGEAGVVLTTQDADTIGSASDTAVSAANFSGVFTTTTSYGADGGGSTTLSYALAVTGAPGAGGRVDSNLDSQGASIYLYNVGGTIVGSTALTAGAIADGNKIFSVSVNGSGVVTLTQFQQIDHPIANDPSASGAPFDDQNAILGNGLISLTRSGSITDGDGDTATASATIDLGGNIQFTDHGPSATTTASLKVDEDDLSAGNHDTTSPGDDTASASLTGTLGFTPGADTPATVSFAPLGGTAVVDASGHPVTAGGVALSYLWVSGTNTLYASTDGTVGGAVFKIQVTNPSTGTYSFSLLGAVDHPGHDADGQNNGPETAYEDNININLTYTVTDFDKDTATGTLAISIDDDMPILPAAPTNLIVNGDFSQGTFASASFGGVATLPGSVTGWVFANSTFEPPSNLQVERVDNGYLGLHTSTLGSMIDMGASPGNIEISQQLSGLTPGQAYAISFEAGAPYPSTAELQVLWNNVVIGTIDPAGPMTSYAYIVNATGIAANDKITFREVGQGHAVIPGQADEGYHGTYLANVSVIATNFVDEDGLASGNHDSQVGDNVVPNADGDNNEATTTGSLNIQWGADNRDIADATAANSGFVQDGALGAALTGRSVFFTDNSVSFTGASTLTSDGVAITFVLSNNNTKLQGFAGSREVFEVTLSDDDSGKYRFILKDHLDQAPNGDENDITLTFNFTAKDSDGDAVSGRFVVGIDDDVPVITAAADVVTLNEALLPTDGNPGGITQANVGFLHISWGADDGAAKHLAFVKDGNGQVVGPELTSDGVALDYFIRPAADSPGNEQLVAVKHGDDPSVDANLVFSITLYEQGSGYYAFALYQNIDHAAGSDTSTLNFGIKAYDSDGDAVQTALTVKVTDDVPHALSNTPLAVDEDDLSAGNHDTASPGDDAASASLTGTLGFTAGADAPATVSFLPLGGTPVVDANGHPVTSGGVALTYLWVAGTNTLYASTDGTVGGAAFKIEVTNPSTGAYSFSLLGQVDHPGHDDPGVAGTQTAFEDNININLTYTVTDFDKDTATGTLSISIDDDMPIIGASPAPTNLILNGSFEDHGFVNNPGFDTFEAINHWTSGPDNVPFEIQQGNIGDLAPQQGNAKVELDSDPLNNPTSQLNATIQQTISTSLAAGDSYELSFWYSPRPNDGDPDSSSLKVYWNGVVVHTIDSSTQADGWQHVSVIVTAQAGSNTVAFQGAGQPNQLGAYLDNVSLVPAITVDEDGLTGPFATGNHDSQPGDNVVPNTEGLGQDNNEATATGNLNIKWGADDLDSGVDGVSGPFNSFVQDQPNGVGDRSVTFANASVSVTGVSALYSHGDLVTFVLNADHTVLSGVAGAGASARTVFEVSLSDEGTGQFRFVLLDKLDHAPGNNENDIGLSFNFTATDSDGDAVSGTFVVGVDDDVPVANNDTYNPTITGPTIISGLFGNDAFGADGVDTTNATPGQVTVTNGAHGTVVYNNDGTFTYTPNSGYSGSDSFTYTIKDGDGDVSTATVTLASVVTNTIPTAGEAFATVDDEGLPGGIDGNGQSTGDVAGHAFTATGVLPHSFVNDGPAANDPINFSLANNVAGFVGTEAVTYHWNDVTNTLTATSAGRGDIFEIVVDGGLDNGNGNYVFTLLQPVLHAAGDGENDATVVLNYQVVDGTTPVADTATGTLTVTIDDDTPITTALADSVSVNEGNLPSDRNPVEAYPVGVAQSDTGFLHINWGADNGSAKHLEFAKDGNSDPIGPSLTADGVPLLYVIRAPGDSAGNEQIVAYKQGDNPDTNPVFSITLYEGGNGYYTYVQYQNIDHSGVGTDSKTFGFTINAFDADGDSVSQTLTINVTDDTPSAVANTNSVTEGALLTVNAAGGVLTNDTAGADGYASGGGVVGVRAAGVDTTTAVTTGVNTSISGLHGTLHLNADGSYTYQSTANDITSNTTDVFVYTIKDGDGDLSTTTLTINLTDSGITASNDDVTVNEAALPVGTTPASAAETVTGTVTDNVGGGTGPFSYALVGSGTGSHGTLTFNPDGSYSYTLTSPVTGPQADNSINTENNVETFTYKVTDANGNIATNTITIDVIDDIPHAVAGAAMTVTETDGSTAGVNLLANDTKGADGATVTAVNLNDGNGFQAVAASGTTTLSTANGTYTFQADGTWTFDPNANLNNASGISAGFTYRITDGDGDTSTATQAIAVNDGAVAATPTAITLDLNEAALSTAGATGSNSSLTSETDSTPSLSFTAGSDNLTSFAFSGIGNLVTDLNGTGGQDIFWQLVSTTQIKGYLDAGHTLLAVTLDLSAPASIAAGTTGSVTVTATLNDNLQHPDALLAQISSIGNVGVVATDTDGDQTTGIVNINVQDDVPLAAAGPAMTVAETDGSTAGVNLLANDTKGADGATVTHVNFGSGFVAITTGTDLGSGVYQFTNTNGTYTFKADGTWTFDPVVNASNSDTTGNFSYRITDGDGDTSEAAQAVNITNANSLPTAGAVTASVDDEGLTGGIAGDGQSSGDVALPSPENVATGTLTHAYNGDGKAASDPINFAPMDGTTGMVGTESVTYHWASGTNTLVATSNAGRGDIFKVVVDGGSDASGAGNYTLTLLKPIMHALGDNENNASAVLTYQVKDGSSPADAANGTLTVTFNDDTPVAVSESASVNEGQKPTMNVVFVIDNSGSMGSGAGSRMELAKAAAINLLNNSSVDFNQIMVVNFASTASNNTPIWADKADAIAYISGLSANDGTDYDAALAKVTSNWGSGPTPADQTVVYFISDGEPTEDNGTGSVGIVGAEQTAWETFLASKGVAASYAVGISTSVNDTDLTPIAWAPGNPGLPPVIITSAGDLSTTLTGSLPGSVSGNILSNDGFGADGGHIKSITVNGTTYTFDGNATITWFGNTPGAGDTINANGKQITITTDLGGKLVFNFAANGTNQAGEWDYTAPNNIATTSVENFAYTLTDNDGDTVSASLNLTVNNINAAPSGANNTLTVLEDQPLTFTAAHFGFSDPGDTPANAFQAVKITTLETAGTLKLNGVDVMLGQVIDIAEINAGHLIFTGAQNANGTGYATFTFQVQDNGGTANGGQNLDQTPNTMTINVTAVNDAPTITGLSALSYTENAPATLVNANVTVADVDSSNFNGGTLTIAFSANGTSADQLAIFANGSGSTRIAISGSSLRYGGTGSGSEIATFTGGTNGAPLVITFNDDNATAAAIERIIESITYANTSEAPSELPRTVSYTLVDGDGTANGGLDTVVATATINVAAVNDAPVNTVPGTQTVNEDTNKVVAGLSVGDVDAGTATNVTTTLAVAHGTLTVLSAGGASVSGSGTGLVTLTGTVAQINTTLAAANNVVYRGLQDYNGTDTLTITTNDNGNTGSGGAKTDIDTVTINITPVDDAPVANADPNIVTNVANGTHVFIPTAALLKNDTDVDGDTVSVQAVTAGTGGAVGLTTVSGTQLVDFTHTTAGSFTYTASDGSAPFSLPATVTVTNVASFSANAASQILIGNNAATTYQFSTNDGNDAIRDLGGTDAIQITTAVTSLLDFERSGSHLAVSVDQSAITVYDHYNGQAIESLAFNAGGTAYGFSLGTGTYNLTTGLSGANNAHDIVAGTSSGETLAGGGGTGTDLLFGNGGNDTLNATGSGNHLLVGGTGNDNLNGGTGNDVYGFDLNDGIDVITDGGGTDAIFVRTLGAALNALNAYDNNTGSGNGDLVIEYNGQQVTVINHFDSDTSAVESISFDGGSVYGYDLGTTSYTINNDDPSGSPRTVTVASGNNFIAGENGAADLITGGTGKDLLFGGTQNDTLNGGAGNDLLVGGGGNDTLNGGNDNDVLVGGIGNDILDGGAGLDRFFYGETGTANQDTINNYNGTGASKDVIDLSALLDATFGPSSNIDNFIKVTDTGANALVQIDATGTGNFTSAGNVATLTGYGTVGNIVSVYLEGAEHQVQVTV